jgi:hypothetical protein
MRISFSSSSSRILRIFSFAGRSLRFTLSSISAAYRVGVPIEQIERGSWLACLRWYCAVLNGNPLTPICSFRYFAGPIDEVADSPAGPSYWVHVQHKMVQVEQLWLNQGKPAGSEPAPPEAQTEAASGFGY